MSSVFENLRQRKIVQWGLAYLAAAWIGLQVATTVGGNFDWPPSVLRAITVLLAAGLPVVLVLAWYHGEQGRQRVSGPELLMVAALLVVAGASLALVRGRGDEESISADAPATPLDEGSIAVLPFANLSGDPEQEFFSDGMTEEIISHLAKIDGLKVISRTSVMRYKDTPKSLREIARELGVATVLEGSVRREGDQVRVTAQLVDAGTDVHLWTQTYDRQIESLFAIQSDVAQAIARALEVELSASQRERIARIPTTSQEAYQLYLRGRYLWNLRTFEDLQRALNLFGQAVQRDPRFALAHVAMAETYLLLPQYGNYPRGEALSRAETAAERALELDPSSGEAYVTLATLAHYDWEWDRADELFRRAIELSPGYATGHQWYAEFLDGMGRTDEAVAAAERARELDPQSMIIHTILTMAYYYDRRYDDAIAAGKVATEMTDEVINPYAALLLALQAEGRYLEAIEIFGRIADLAVREALPGSAGPPPDFGARLESAFRERGERGYWEVVAEVYETFRGQPGGPCIPPAVAYVKLGDRERALSWIELSVEQRSAGLPPNSFFDPGLDPLRGDPRFARLFERIGLDPPW